MKIEMIDSGDHLTEQDIVILEKQIGCSIPIEYREFLLFHNSGHPRPSNFTMLTRDGSTDFGAVNFFLGVNISEETLNLADTLKTFHNRIPSDFFPIALDPGGNLIGIISGGADIGKIYFWDSEEESEEGEPATRENLYFIADNFNKFMNGLSE